MEGVYAAITIKASNVVLDMKGHALWAKRNVPLSGVIGISADGAENLSLRNGTIKGFQLFGVTLLASTGATLSEIVISDVGNGVPGFTPSGLLAMACQDLNLNSLSVHGVNGSWCEPSKHTGRIVSGISLIGCDDVSIDGSISGVNGYASVVSGVFAILCDGITLKKLEIDHINGSAIDVSGASFGVSQNINIQESAFSNLHNDAGVCSGIATDDCRQIRVLNTTVNGLSTGLMPNENAVGHTCIGMVFRAGQGGGGRRE